MKIEKINDNQIKCTLNKSDLASREIKISELAYGTEKAKDLFRDMMQQASYEFGFEAEDIPLMIEAIPVSPDCIVLLITKVEDPEELDTRFSKFAPSDEDDEDDDDDDEDELEVIEDNDTGVLGLINDVNNFISQIKDTLPDNKDAIDESNSKTQDPKAVTVGEYDIPQERIIRCYSFSSLNQAITACHFAKKLFKGESSMYKTPDNNYYIVFSDDKKTSELIRLCNIFSEYAEKIKVTLSSPNYFDEHYECIIEDDAINKLSKI